ncbi:unnamed protein product [Rotaria socialis]|uniref:TIR domain-containing protein n=1 Tax=Rotaria socialis TaxID=392032 RepID=A0A821CST6_9BILA|nr:unnamed protein product [Rotaria socialis]
MKNYVTYIRHKSKTSLDILCSQTLYVTRGARYLQVFKVSLGVFVCDFASSFLSIYILELVQEEKVQETFAEEEKGLSTLVKCASETEYDDLTIKLPSLESLWTLVFVEKAAQSLKHNQHLIDYLKSILQIDANIPNKLRKAADGLYWKLEKEPERLQDKKTAESEPVNYIYDAMISYNHKNEEISHKLWQKLTDNNFRIWIDKEKMFGSIMERMAEGVERSEFVIICMSPTYAASPACQSEATYAKSKKRALIPIEVQKDFKPRGWLAILIGDLYRVSFTKQSFDRAYQDLLNQIDRNRIFSRQTSDVGLDLPRPVSERMLSRSTYRSPTLSMRARTDRETSPHQKYVSVATSPLPWACVDRGTNSRYRAKSRATSPMRPAMIDRTTSPLLQKRSVYTSPKQITSVSRDTSTDNSVRSISTAASDSHTAMRPENTDSRICSLI